MCITPPRQKFPIGTRVRIAKDLGKEKNHFAKDCDAIVVGSYAQQYPTFGREQINDYELLILSPLGRGIHTSAWYQTYELTRIKGSISQGEKLIKSYFYGDSNAKSDEKRKNTKGQMQRSSGKKQKEQVSKSCLATRGSKKEPTLSLENL